MEGKDAVRVFSIYRTMSHGNPILPSALAFILDRETRTQQQINELVTQSNNRAMFLSRRMFENYLLNSEAIAQVMNSIEHFSQESITAAKIDALVNEKVKENVFFSPLTAQSDWKNTVNAGKLLSWLFGELSEHRAEYRKTQHSVMLAKWLLDNQPGDLAEVAGVLTAALKRSA